MGDFNIKRPRRFKIKRNIEKSPFKKITHIKIDILGVILIILGLGFLYNPTSLNLKISFTSILIGFFWIFLITEKNIPIKISEKQIQGSYEALEKIIREYNLSGNAVFLPKSKILNEEKIYIPREKTTTISLNQITDDSIFIFNKKDEILGISLPPSGIKLLNEIDKEVDFENISIEKLEQRLQKFIGMNLLKSISLKNQPDGFILEIDQPLSSKYDQKLLKQYPSPTCSAALTAITRATKKIFWIKNAKIKGNKITFHLHVHDIRKKQGNKN
jgi:hypothetical protein